ncbi:MAG: NUDIX hydrolase [Candidatus Aenigmatarchaeota archaeon]
MNDHPWIGVDGIILNNKGQILLVKRSTKTEFGKWGLVGGWMEWGETVKEALKREVKEEIGVEIEVVKFVGKYYDAKDRHPTKSSIGLPHICKIVKGEPKPVSEVSEVRWFSSEEIKNLDMAYDHKQMLKDARLI